jgi:hypothetical protein
MASFAAVSILTEMAQAGEPARGAPVEDVGPASLIALVAVLALTGYGWLERTGRARWLGRAAGLAESVTGLPGWSTLPAAICGAALASAAFGFYWDVSLHIDQGRDPGPFANPAHWFILAGLAGLALAGVVSVIIGSDERNRSGLLVGRDWRVPVGGWLLLLCGGVALLGFPLDDVWHRLFGQDVTMWGPTHLQMIVGASLGALATWALVVEGHRALGPARRLTGFRHRFAVLRSITVAGAFLIGLSALQGEFDFGVPQFRLLYHPILIAFAAGIGLVAARVRIGRGGALGAVAVFLVVRLALTAAIAGPLDRIPLHLPLYLVEALLVEGAALVVGRRRPITLGAVAGLLIGTVGTAAEWVWAGVAMLTPWTAALFPEVLVLAPLAGVAGGVIGGCIGAAFAPPGVERQRLPTGAGMALAAAVFVVLAYPLPMSRPPADWQASVVLSEATDGPAGTVDATIRLDPPDLADGAEAFQLLAWQGAEGDEQSYSAALRQVEPGVWQTSRPVPVDGEWKAILRVQRGNVLAAVPIRLPEDAAIPAPEVPAEPSFTRAFVADKDLLQREYTGGAPWLTTAAYLTMLLIALTWISAFAWGLRRLTIGSNTGGSRRALRPVLRAPTTSPVGGR